MDRKLVTICLFGTFLIVILNRAVVTHQFPKPRVFLGGVFAFVAIGFLVEIAPELAAAFAILLFTSVLLTEGADTFNGLSKITGGTK